MKITLKSISLFLFIFNLISNVASAQQDSLGLLFGLGVGGIAGGSNISTDFRFSAGVNNQNAGYLFTISYSEQESPSFANRNTASLALELLLPTVENLYFGIGPEILFRMYGPTFTGIGSLHYAVSEHFYFGIFYSGYSKLGTSAILRF